jgi:LCP family protein required for cell wall assembly
MGQTPQNQAGQYSRSNPQYSKASAKRMGKGPKIAIAALCVVVLLFAGGGTAFAMYMNSINETLKGDKTEEEQQAIADTLAPVHNYTEPFYMLLIGSDAREGSEEEGQRSDTNILVRVDPTNCVVTMLSIPRDTKITIDGYGTNKFNAAYQYGGAASTIKEANQLCGVEISHYAEINFESMIKLVDVIGGVEVDVPELVDDPDAGPVVVQPGLQTLNGEAALTFARSRAYADGDFTRTSNQRLLIEALVTKVLSMPLTDLPGVIQEAAKCVTTDLSVNQIIDLASQFKDIGQLTVYSGMVPSSTTMISGISYVIADTVKLAEVMAAIDLGQDPSLVWNSEMGYSSSSATEESTSTYSGGSTYYEEPYDSGYYDSGSYDSGGYDSGYYEEDYSGSYDDSYSTEYVEDYAA